MSTEFWEKHAQASINDRQRVILNRPLDGDAGRVCEVFPDILTNAAKYANPWGDIAISAQSRDGAVWLTVRDTGVGIDATMPHHVWKPLRKNTARAIVLESDSVSASPLPPPRRGAWRNRCASQRRARPRH